MSERNAAGSTARPGALARGGLVAFLSLILGAGLQYASNIVLARAFGAEAVGVFAFAFGVAMLAATLGQAGFRDAFVRFLPQYLSPDGAGETYGICITAVTIVSCVSLLFSGVLYGIAGQVASSAGDSSLAPSVRLLALAVLPLALGSLFSGGFQAARLLGRAGVSRELGRAISLALAAVACWLAGWSFSTFVHVVLGLFWLLAGASGVLFYRFMVDRSPVRAVPVFVWRSWLRFSSSVVLMDVFRASSSWIDTIVLGFTMPSARLAVYYTALKTAIVLTLVLGSMNAIMSPVVAAVWARRKVGELQSVFVVTTRWIWIFTIPMAIVMLFARRELMAFYGPEFIVDGPTVLAIIVVGRAGNALTGGVGQILIMTGHERVELFNSGLVILCFVVGMIFVVPPYGVIGAAWVNAAIVIGINALKLAQVRYLLGVHPFNWGYVRLVAVLAVSVSLALLVLQFVGSGFASGWGRVALFCGLFGLTYAAGLWVAGLESGDRELVRDVVARRRRSRSG